MIHDEIRKRLNESMSAVMSCRAAKSSIALWRKRLARITDPRQKLMAQKMIIKKKLKVNKCKQRGLMI
jgi:hypothetical protein